MWRLVAAPAWVHAPMLGKADLRAPRRADSHSAQKTSELTGQQASGVR